MLLGLFLVPESIFMVKSTLGAHIWPFLDNSIFDYFSKGKTLKADFGQIERVISQREKNKFSQTLKIAEDLGLIYSHFKSLKQFVQI